MLSAALLSALALSGAVSASAIPTAAPEMDPDMVPAIGEPSLVKRVNAENPWVTVDDNTQPATTYTPSITTIDGSTSRVDAAPHDLTASVYTWTTIGQISTSTGEPPNPTATGKRSEGVFARCFNKDGPNAPFCHPYPNSTLHTGNTYYVTWDPDFFNKTNSEFNATTEATIRLDYLNTTAGVNQYTLLRDDYGDYPTEWGFAVLPITDDLLSGKSVNNVTIQLLTHLKGSNAKNHSTDPLHVAISRPGFPESKPTPAPKGKEVTIAIPATLGAILVLVVGLCIWNRKTRHIKLGNIMSRARHGYSGRSERRRLFRNGNNKDHVPSRGGEIQLDETPPARGPEYRDVPERQHRGSDDLDSLAGSPIQDSFQEQGTTGGRNAFRDEMERQNNERRGGL